MISIKHMAAVLALIGSFGAAVASEATKVVDTSIELKTQLVSVDFQKDSIQFMADDKLADIQGASYKDGYKHFMCMLRHPDRASGGKIVMHCVRHFKNDLSMPND